MSTTNVNKLEQAVARRRKANLAAADAFKDVRDACRRLHDEGKTLREIANIAGVSHVAVRWWIREKDATAV